MKMINLKEKEIEEAKQIIEKYKKLENAFTRVEKQLENLDKQRKELISNLDTARKKEESFFEKLKKSYGNGKLDLYTMKYIVIKNENHNDKSSNSTF